MKILCIRGRNLASLSEEFAIDFTSDPLSSAGLFAITGPTGSGKSTLLDALCLALYGETPRLATAGQTRLPDVNGETITSGDPRAILRRGCGEGYAEVDFVGIDGVAYRARWTARRARGMSGGRLQAIEMSLARVADGQDIGGRTLSEVKREAVAKVGLTFTQFTRAVLLAQNEFATFLKSNDNDRAELLEMLTGNERFSDISRRAYQRAKEELARLEQLQARIADQLPLDSDERSALEANLARADHDVAAIEQRRTTLEGWLRWHEALAKAVADERVAEAQVAKAGETRDAAANRRATLHLVEAVQPARTLLEEHRRLATESAAAVTAGGEAEKAVAIADAAVRSANAALVNGQKSLGQAEQARQAAAPGLARAHALAAQIESLKPGHAEAQLTRQSSDVALKEAGRALEEKQAEFARLQEDMRATRDWLSAHAGRQPLAVEWSRWDILLKQAGATSEELSKAATALKTLTGQVAAASKAAETRQAARITQESLADATARALDAANAEVSGFDRDALVRRRAALEEKRERIADATSIWLRLDDLLARRQAAAAKLDATRKAIAENAFLLEQARSEKPACADTLAGAERALRLAREASTASIETLRAALEDGSPCPVCGAVEHPWADHDPGLRAALGALERDMKQAQKALDAVSGRLAAAETRADHLAREQLEADRALADLAEACAAAQSQWDSDPLADEAPGAETRKDWLASRAAANRGALDALAGQEKALRDAESRRDAAQRDATAAQQELTTATAAATAAAVELQRLEQELTAAQHRTDTFQRQSDAVLDQLDAAFPDKGWRDAWQASPHGFSRSAGEQADEWLTKQQHVTTLESQSATLQAALKEMSVAVEAATRQLVSAQERFTSIDDDIASKNAELHALFEGRSAAEVDAALTGALDKAGRAVAEKQFLVAEAGKAQAKAAEALDQRKLHAQSLAQATSNAAAAMREWLEDFNASRDAEPVIDAGQLAVLLAHDATWIQQERAELGRLDVALAEAQAVHKSLRDAREAHEATRPSEDAAEAIREKFNSVKIELVTANDRKAALAVKRAQDDERRAKHAAISSDLVAQEARTRTWSQLNDMIGSADGKKFRNIAQQITLDVLLGYANRHLESLARRYRLERIAETLDLMVIDRDMADEVRSVHSLSGGESFLVSLALALGLASLSSHRVKVESLFIDEGFGSLDADSLRIAMDALDGLQAQGRKVGVISHVQEMTERIGTQIRIERQGGGKSRVSMAST